MVLAERLRQKSLKDALPEQAFWVNNGPVIRNLAELAEALKDGRVSDDQFRYHISRGKNDFAAWIENVLGETQCAKQLTRVRTKKTALRIITECLRDYR